MENFNELNLTAVTAVSNSRREGASVFSLIEYNLALLNTKTGLSLVILLIYATAP